MKRTVLYSVVDPGFPRGGSANFPGGQHTILPNFLENCMKSKEFGCEGRGAHAPRAPLNPPMVLYFHMVNIGGQP